jgi:hypothetical protein
LLQQPLDRRGRRERRVDRGHALIDAALVIEDLRRAPGQRSRLEIGDRIVDGIGHGPAIAELALDGIVLALDPREAVQGLKK